MKFDFGEIWQLDSAADHLLHAQSWCVPSPKHLQFQAFSHSIQFQFGEGLPGRVWQTRAPHCIEDRTASDYFTRISAATSAGIRGAFAVPLGFFQGIFGVMAFFSHERITMDEELSNFLMSIGSQPGQFLARKIAEAERERIGRELVLILESTSEGIYGGDLAGSITFINRSAARSLGVAPERVVGKNSHNLFHHTRQDGTPYPESDCPLSQLLQAGRAHSTDLDYFCRIDGSQLAVSYSAVPMFEGAHVSGALINCTDISEKRQMDIELRHAQKLAAVGGLAAGIAHEINTPIQFIGDNTRFVRDSFRDGLTRITHYEEISQQARNGSVPPELLQSLDAICTKIEWAFLKTEIPKALEQMMDGVNRVATIVRAMKEFSHVDRSADKVAAMLSQIGCVTLPPATLDKLYKGEALTGPEKVMVDRMPTVVEKCLSNIPRMDAVITILRLSVCQFAHPKQRNGIAIVGELPWGARALKIALDFDSLEAGGNPAEQPMAVMRGREGWYDPQILEAYAGMRGISQEKTLMLERMVKNVTVGMTFGEDLKSGKGLLLIARGQEVTPALLERMRNFSAELAIREPVRMLLPNPALVAKEAAPAAKAPAPAVSHV